MKARLTSISLTLPGRVLEIGTVVERGVDLPEELFDARLKADTAQLVGVAHEPREATVSALALYREALGPLQAALAMALDAVDAGGLPDARAFIDTLHNATPIEGLADRIQAVAARVLQADQAELQSLSSAGSPVSGENEAGAGGATSEAGGDRGGPSPPAQTSETESAPAKKPARKRAPKGA